MTESVEEYAFDIKRIDISDKLETTLYIKNIQVQLGTDKNLDKKLSTLNDMYKSVIKYKGILNMKRVSTDGRYTLKKTEPKTQKGKKDKE